MQQITGKGISPGIAVGKIRYQKKEQKKIISRAVEDAEKECERYHRAISYVDEQLRKLYVQSRSGNGETGAAIYDSYRIILEDEEFVGAVKRRIKKEKVCAEYAIGQIKEKYIQVFSASEDELLKARIADIEDVSGRLILRLLQDEDDTGDSEKQSISSEEALGLEKDSVILLAESLSPSEFIDAEKDGLLAVITQHGSELSHTAILARMSEIPMITGVTADLSWDGKTVIADGNTGVLTIDPDEETIAEKCRMREEKAEQRKQLRTLIGLPSETRSGKRIRICANIGGIEDVDPALNNDAEGIGLFRSEFLYIESDHFPSEEKQFQIYRTATQRMGERQTVIRTLDIGSDKQLDYFDLNAEGREEYRGIQICLDHPDIFRKQLRAIYRASAYGKTAILFPMITTLEEVQQCKKYAEEVKRELIKERFVIDENVALGIMIETPEAVRISETLAKEVDFFSIGTNDLTYYAMKDLQRKKISDTRSDVSADADVSVVLELIRKTVKSAHRAGIPAAICGEMAADTNLTGRFLDYGIDELSVVPAKVLVLRSRVRELD